MCFNSEVSLLTYFAGMSGTYVLYKENKIPEALFCGWVVQMQLVDFLLWQNSKKLNERNELKKIEQEKCNNGILCNIDSIDDCNNTNKFVSKLGLFINHLEPFVLYLGITKFSKKQLSIYIHIIIFIYFILYKLF
jgi:hypothetical protein